MTGASWKVTLDDEAARKTFDALLDRIENRIGFYRDVGEHLLNSTLDNFRNETGPDGQRWKNLLPSTIDRREKRGQTPISILRASGRLAGSINIQVGNDQVSIGTPVEYAAIHQVGGDIRKPERQHTIYQHYDKKTDTFDQRFRRKSQSNFARDVTIKEHSIKMEARPFLGISQKDEPIIVAIAEEWLKGSDGEFK